MISVIAYDCLREIERAERQGGPEAAKRVRHQLTGQFIGCAKGALVGGAIGSIVPVVGTGIGVLLGGFLGGLRGHNDETALDNVKSATGLVRAFFGNAGKL